MDRQKSEVAITAHDGRRMVLTFVADDIVRVQASVDGRFSKAWLLRYGFVISDWPSVSFSTRTHGGKLFITTKALQVIVSLKTLALEFRDKSGKVLLREAQPGRGSIEDGFHTVFNLPAKTEFFGLGDQTRERIEHRGTCALMWIRNLLAYIPIPFLLTNHGYALLVNTTRKHVFDLGQSSPRQFGFESREGSLDYYFMRGETPAQLLECYTRLTGRPPMPPKWTFGLWFVAHFKSNAYEVIDTCLRFRERGIPCDAMCLETQWMSKYYDDSTEKKFDTERFYILPYFYRQAEGIWVNNIHHAGSAEVIDFLDAMRNLGFKPGLWLAQNYDLSYEAERQVQAKSADTDSRKKSFNFASESVVDLIQDAKLKDGAVINDRITKPDEPWFEHLKKFVRAGVEYFKMDACTQTLEHPDRVWLGNGMKDDEMHNLYPLLYSDQMTRGFRELTGRRSAIFTPNGWTGLQRFPGTWTGDIGGGPKPLVSCLNLSMSGHTYTTTDMDNASVPGIHAGFLLPWSQVGAISWNFPWLAAPDVRDVFTEYARLRYRLIPYLYTQAYQAWLTGLPIMRPFPLAFPDDPRSSKVLNEYMLGDSLLVTAFDNNVYLPYGEWTDYWTGALYKGPTSFVYTPPPGKGGGLFVRAGAIIPFGPVMDYVGQVQETPITLDVYPNADGEGLYYEDDGDSYDYEKGKHALTSIQMRRTGRDLRLEIGPRQGRYKGMPEELRFGLQINAVSRPRQVLVNKRNLAEQSPDTQSKADGWKFDTERNLLVLAPRVHRGKMIIEVKM
jgi:alpha-glucosidase (family GH31 glycosyl hydrolase)